MEILQENSPNFSEKILPWNDHFLYFTVVEIGNMCHLLGRIYLLVPRTYKYLNLGVDLPVGNFWVFKIVSNKNGLD